MSKSAVLPVNEFESLLWAEEVEERVEFASWYAKGTVDGEGNVGAEVGVTWDW